MRYLLLIFLLIFPLSTFAQSGRIAPGEPAAAADQTTKKMFEEVTGYPKAKYNEYALKKVAYSDALVERTKGEQRALAAKYAASAGARKDLFAEDRYYIGMMHWIAVNLDGAVENLTQYLAAPDVDAARSQTARSVVIVAWAKQKKLEAAEKLLAEYLSKEPIKLTERSRMEGELAKGYQSQRDYSKMAPHADADYGAAKALIKDADSRARGLDEILDAAMLVFEAYRDLGQREKAEAALEDLRGVAVTLASTSLYYYAVDQKIKYLIDSGRKPAALQLYAATLTGAAKDFIKKEQQDYITDRFRHRDLAYRLLGGPAVELPVADKWFPGEARSLASMKGKVVLLDFWAMWCAPCIEAFPDLKEWHDTFAADGFEILGLTRYYGSDYGYPADHPGELQLLKGFRQKNALPYDMVVGDGQEMQILYGAMNLPTAVIIDRKGIVRYVETGTSKYRLSEMRAMIMKLLAEK
jgi:thiol-disulfide isomerase/thioredoxin